MDTITILIAVGQEDRERAKRMAETVRTVVGERESRVLVGHVLTESEYEQTAERLEPAPDAETKAMSAARPETSVAYAGTAGETSAPGEAELPTEEAVKQVIGQLTVVRDLSETLRGAGFEPEVLGGVGDAAEGIVEMIDDHDADFVVIGGRDRSPTRQAMFGSVSQEILRSAGCPAISVRGVDES